MWNKSQIASFQKALAGALKLKPAVAKLAELARFVPQFEDRIRALQLRLENAESLATIALAADAQQ